MRLKGEEYSKRLEGFSTPTLRLLADVRSLSREAAYRASDITTDSELTEAQVVEKLKELKKFYSTTKETK